MTRDGVPADPRVPGGRGAEDEVDLRAVDVAAVAATDVLLDRLAARRPLAEDLDDPAAAVLALLAAEVDLNPVPEDALRRELFDLGVWPLVPSGTPPTSFLPPTEVLDLRPAWREDPAPARGPAGEPVGGPAWRSDRPGAGLPGIPAARRGEADVPRPLRVRVRLLAVAATVVVGLCGVSAAVTGAWNPVRGGSIIAGTDEGSQIEDVVLAGLDLVDSNDLSAAEARLEDAHRRARNADLTSAQRKKVDAALRKLATALVEAGFPVPPQLLPDVIATAPAAPDEAAPSAVPTTDVPSARTSSTTATSEPSEVEESTTTDPPAPTQDEETSSSTTPRPSSTSASRTTEPETSSTSSTRTTGPPSDKGGPTRTKTKTKASRTADGPAPSGRERRPRSVESSG
ncbi:hypothetical protein [Kineosporia sp. R_H_3]|uniref:hypothetical protein n=1 Tax=Kineosporia sp. R_H_3 TaxID=1961848 RepID=UPI000B4B756F|nr:hypothetical protein [Kineosporia sp. R_H_3]